MLNKIITKKIITTISLSLVLMLSGILIYQMQRKDVIEDIKAEPKAVQPEMMVSKFEIKAEKKLLIVNPDALKDIRMGQGQITIPGTAHVAAPEPVDIQDEKEIAAVKPMRDHAYVGVSIANTSGEIIPSSIVTDEPNDARHSEMIFVENMGLPQGVDFRTQPVRALAQKGMESQELKRLKEIRLKRKANFAKELEERRAHKELYDR